jgi:proteasome assembly chaperone (PAC2) family protein
LGIQFYAQPNLDKPILIACWPGLGNIGPLVGENLKKEIQAHELAEIDPWEFFYPRKASFKNGVLEEMEFPGNKFYFRKLQHKDVIIFIGEEEPDFSEGSYIPGKKAFQLGNMVLDVAEKFGCRRIYTSCAAISLTHHEVESKVWGVVSHEYLKPEVKGYPNTILVSESEDQRYNRIPGLKGLLAGLAKHRGMEAICLRGEMPDYLARIPIPYPRASKAVLEVLARELKIDYNFEEIDEMISNMKLIVDKLLEEFPPENRERIDQRKSVLKAKPETITQEEENWINQHIDELFKKGNA